jgi:hypothetical protein
MLVHATRNGNPTKKKVDLSANLQQMDEPLPKQCKGKAYQQESPFPVENIAINERI